MIEIKCHWDNLNIFPPSKFLLTPELLVVELAEEVAQVEALVEVALVVHLGEVVEEGLVLPQLKDG
jgi:hypothetical protein